MRVSFIVKLSRYFVSELSSKSTVLIKCEYAFDLIAQRINCANYYFSLCRQNQNIAKVFTKWYQSGTLKMKSIIMDFKVLKEILFMKLHF